MRRVIVKIDRLALKGFRYEDRHAIAQGLQEQLALLFADPSMAQRLGSMGSISRLRVGPVAIPAEATPQQVGVAGGMGLGKG